MKVENNKVVTVHYIGTFPESDEVFDSSKDKDPMSFLVGHKNMIEGFERELMGAETDETREFTLTPEDAYGNRNEEAIQEMPRDQFPEELEIGMMFQAQSENGPMQFTINEVLEDIVKIDFNHPMAGKILKFSVTVIEIRDASEEELTHGHAHGAHGQHH
ncbi:MAG: FKBP-type peptidyl-prolyl cis-trans isomerase SlyD [Candidatus Thalassarchaeaceae archaeon]|jgi:FKBP-type peptidyl-prolyl cis-trans isomerase SlyD